MVIKTKKTGVNKAQRTASVAFALFVLFQAPLFTYPVKVGNDVKHKAGGPLEVVTMWMLANRPAVASATKWIILPGIWYKEAGKAGYFCVFGSGKDTPCSQRMAAAFDLGRLLQLSDYTQRMEEFEDSIEPKGLRVLQAASGVLVMSALTMLIVPNSQLKMVIIGLVLLSWAIFKTGITPLPSAMFMTMLIVMAAFPPPTPPPQAATAKVQGSQAGSAAAVSSPPQKSGPSPGGGKVTKRQKA